ncbi:MAG: sulfotransferase domain-containing protein [Bacteroidetes bacterium]|nr:sulfotransferase domain-containing protein [Bacteroidota bacterium]
MERKKPEILLTSFPRSGNTYLRNILFEVYGIYSWNNLRKYYNNVKHQDRLRRKIESGKSNDIKLAKLEELKAFGNFPILKSHELPHDILPYCVPDVKIIYMIRDGRDACVSAAHHRSDLVAPGSDYYGNLKQAIQASLGSYFGGWSKNVEEWMKISHKVIFFEDLVKNPIEITEQLRDVLDLPEPDTAKLPTFESQREGKAHFGGSARPQLSDEEKDDFNKKFFRKGAIGGWKEEMPEELQLLFWEKHGQTMEKIGYLKDGTIKRSE